MKTNAAVTSPFFWLCFLRKAIRSYFDLGAEYTFLKIIIFTFFSLELFVLVLATRMYIYSRFTSGLRDV